MKKFYIVLIGLLIGFGVGVDLFGQTTVYYQENFTGMTKDNMLTTGWDISNVNGSGGGQLNGRVDLANDELHILAGGWYCAPGLTNVDVSNYDDFVISFRYKSPKPLTHSSDELNVYLGEEYVGWNNIGYQQLLLQSGNDNTYKYASIKLDSWPSSDMQLCFFVKDNGGDGVYIDDIQIKGVTANNPPVVNINASSRMVFEEDIVQLFDVSTEAPTSWEWDILSKEEGVDYNYVDNTSKYSQNPKIEFLLEGIYDIGLTASNAHGTNSRNFVQYITVSCPAKSENIEMGHIKSVSIGSKGYSSANPKTDYTSYADDPAFLSLGNSFNVSLQTSSFEKKQNSDPNSLEGIGNSYWWDSEQEGTSRNVKVWFDWNRDGFFEEDPRLLPLGEASSGNTYWYEGTVSVDLPEFVTPGKVNARIKLANRVEDVEYACGNVGVGEVEDFAINFYSGSVSNLLGNAFEFNGGYAETENPVLTDEIAFAIEGWFKISQVTGNHGFIGQSDAFSLGIKSGELVFEMANMEFVSIPWNYTGQWVHLAATADATGNLTLYVNGNVVNSVVAQNAQYWNGASNSNLRFAQGVYSSDNGFIGQMDEIRIWSEVPDAATIANNMYSSISVDEATGLPSGLLAYYQFNDVQISESLKDWKGNNHATHYDAFSDAYVISGVPFIWTGATDGLTYTFPGNWSWGENEIPFSANKAILTNNVNVELPPFSNYRVGSLELQQGAQFTISDNSSLNILDSLILRNTYDQLSTFMDIGDVIIPEGKTRIQLTVPKNYYWYLSSPLANARAKWFGNLNNDPNAEDWVFVLRESGGKNKWLRVVGDIALNPLEGVSTWYYNQDKQLDYSGTLNKGNISFTYGQPDYYLLGNPYATSIDWDILEAENRDGLDFAQTMWFRVSRTGFDGETYRTWQTYNTFFSAIDPEELGYSIENESYIAPYQTVWIKADVSNATFTVSENSKVKHTGALPLKSAGSSNNSKMDVLRIKAVNDKTVDGAVIFFNNAGDPGRDSFDSDKRFNDSKAIPELYTMLNSTPLAINSLPQLSGTAYSIPLSVRNRIEGEVKLSVDVREFTDAYDVVLEDKELSSWINMRDVSEYAYNPRIMGDDHDRFVLHLSKVQKVPTDIEESVDDALNIQIIGKKDYAAVRISPELLQSSEAVIHVLDVNGRQITNKNTRDTETEIALPSENGVYVVHVNAGGTVKTQKVVR